ncbi:signal recognition particle subunit [Podospora pseudoanserina]|uniref:Signal recognition particle subunit n=1 Tax=Podospora pseudoanserina TaxID=2609844 RepID=A0ABR0HSU2_9PEZI|nr:signal recognition particle subunit [Podospora pseudoanserina]
MNDKLQVVPHPPHRPRKITTFLTTVIAATNKTAKMSHPRVEEVSDSEDDVQMSDPSEDDIDDFVESDIIRTRQAAPSRPTPLPQQQPPPQFRQPQQPPAYPQMQTTTDATPYASYLCLYPIYFSSLHTRAQGRRVSAAVAVPNPLATEILAACANLNIPTVFEAGKLHPKDWANPGRVKVSLANQTRVKNKHHLFLLVAQHLTSHPITDASPALRVHVRGAPPPPELKPGEQWPRPAVPRGWKMSELLPHYSPAMTGGGVSENFLKDMMSQMGGAGGAGGLPGMLGGGGGGPGGMDMASLMQAAQSMGMGGMGGMGGLGGLGGGSSPGPSSSAGGKAKKGKK